AASACTRSRSCSGACTSGRARRTSQRRFSSRCSGVISSAGRRASLKSWITRSCSLGSFIGRILIPSPPSPPSPPGSYFCPIWLPISHGSVGRDLPEGVPCLLEDRPFGLLQEGHRLPLRAVQHLGDLQKGEALDQLEEQRFAEQFRQLGQEPLHHPPRFPAQRGIRRELLEVRGEQQRQQLPLRLP